MTKNDFFVHKKRSSPYFAVLFPAFFSEILAFFVATSAAGAYCRFNFGSRYTSYCLSV